MNSNKEIDDLIEWGESDLKNTPGHPDFKETPILPKDTEIRKINNRDFDFSGIGADERTAEYWQRKIDILKGKIKSTEEKEMKDRLKRILKRIEDNIIDSRFDILDL